MSSALLDAMLGELDEQQLRRLAERLRPYLADAAPEAPELLTATEAAALLRCNRKRVYELGQRGALPVHRDGGRVLFHRSDLTAYLTSAAA